MASEWLEVQTFEVGEEGNGRTKPLLIRPEAVVSVEELQGVGTRTPFWRFLNTLDGDCVSVLWTSEVAEALGLGEATRPFQGLDDDVEGEDYHDAFHEDEPLRSQTFREFVAEVNRQRARAGREPFEMTAAGMAAASQDYRDTFHRDPSLCPSPASPPAAAPAEETSSEGERCTAGGVKRCSPPHPEVGLHGQWCDAMYTFRVSVLPFLIGSENLGLVRLWTSCPWCGEKLGGEG